MDLLHPVNSEKNPPSFSFFFFSFSLLGFCLFVCFPLWWAFHGHTSAMASEAIHGCVYSFLVYLFMHNNLFSLPICKISRVYNKHKTPNYSWSHQSEFQDLPDSAQPKPEASLLWVCTHWWASHYPKFQYLPQSNCFSSGSQNLSEGSPLFKRESQKELKDNPVLPPFKGDSECVGLNFSGFTHCWLCCLLEGIQ